MYCIFDHKGRHMAAFFINSPQKACHQPGRISAGSNIGCEVPENFTSADLCSFFKLLNQLLSRGKDTFSMVHDLHVHDVAGSWREARYVQRYGLARLFWKSGTGQVCIVMAG